VQKRLTRILKRLTDVLLLVHNHLYFPSYSSGLKHIGHFFGSEWTETRASGLESVLWREAWELDHDPRLKDRLTTYNKEDCQALQKLCVFISHVSSHDGIGNADEEAPPGVVHTSALRQHTASGYKFGRQTFALEDLRYVNDATYVDYQREKVFVRTDSHLRALAKRKAAKPRSRRKINKRITLDCEKCPICGSHDIAKGHKLSQVRADLKFFQSGVRQWTVKYSSRKVPLLTSIRNVSISMRPACMLVR
jgi:hypothetical protein